VNFEISTLTTFEAQLQGMSNVPVNFGESVMRLSMRSPSDKIRTRIIIIIIIIIKNRRITIGLSP